MQFPQRFSDLPEYAFPRLRALLSEVPAGGPVIEMTIGEPQHPVPDFVGPLIARYAAEFRRYPPNEGTSGLRGAIAEWLARRYGALLDPEHIHPPAQRHPGRPLQRSHRTLAGNPRWPATARAAAQSVLPGLRGRRARLRRRAPHDARNRRDRLSPGSRRARPRRSRPSQPRLCLLALQPPGRRCRCDLVGSPARTRGTP